MIDSVRGKLMGLAVALILVLSVGPAQTASAQEGDCRGIRARTVELAAAQDLAGLQAEFDRAQTDVTCSEEFRTWLGTTIATLMGNEAYHRVQSGAAIADQEALLRESLQYRRQWRALFWLGDIAMERDDYEEAGRFYQQALASISDVAETPEAPAPEVIELVFTRAQEAQLLAETYVESPTTRSGESVGTTAPGFRGFVPEAVAVPVQFEFDSTLFTAKGLDAATDLFRSLLQQGEPAITLIGHTDSRGARAYNQGLSERRAAVLRAWLINQGYRGPIRIMGLGEDRPFPVTDASRYTIDEIHAMNRRVELRRDH
jgi:outer membrane protein OmpA-like peptidoglycan-associated protein